MRLKIFCLTVLILCLCVCLFSFDTAAAYGDELKSEISEDFFSSIDSDIASALEKIGVTDFDYEQIYNVSIRNITDYFKEALPQKLKVCFADFLSMLFVVMLVSIASSFYADTPQGSIIKIIAVICITVMSVEKISPLLNMLISLVRLSGGFMLCFIPVLTLLLSLSGTPTLAFTFNSFIMGFSQAISAFINFVAVDLLGCFLCVCISMNLNETLNVSRFINTVNKLTAFVLGITASVFTGFLSIKSVMAVSVDSVAVKGIRFAISSLIPVLGSSISEAYSSVIGSINIIKSSVAFVGILAIILINIPVIVQMLMYKISFSLLSYICESTGAVMLSDTFRGFCCAMRILLLLCVFEMFVLIISTGIMLVIRGGG